ncbi:RPEL repeat protein [Ancylostoma caninum]|uniref:RPEL repeat protein n=1 Tax=Ancylostoma caninum TaxID=29170 RepID=A0A368G4N4_ANCCA|nr:RPEL repeat protein [Ancylostoma caninum]
MLSTKRALLRWATARGEQLRKKIEQRPSRERLLNQHILLSDGRVAPLIEQRARLLRQDRIRRNLSRKLEARPGPLELVTRKILQADADLEQAIEGMSVGRTVRVFHVTHSLFEETWL